MNTIFLALLTLTIFVFWDILIRIKYIFSRKSIEKWVDIQFHRICNLLFSFTAFLVNVHIHFERPKELALPETFLLVANHQSIQDIPLLIWSFPNHELRFCAKDSLFRRVPMVSIMLRIQQHGRIDRHGNAADTLKTLERVALKSKNGYCPVVFPEGTRSRDGNLGPFHLGAVRKMLSTNTLPVVTAAIEGGWRVGDVKGLIENMKDFNYQVKILRVHEAPETKKEIRDILDKAYEDIEKQLSAWREEERKVPKTSKGHHYKPY
ncbi:MAG: 1-acyl-sn-glycerol-3-phosphate acyltransferase [Spirochaetales bacterium]|nr:1-acyl-sn-glycerol-3-phosphate acyltransferase [Spirochaetales bacterium]